MGIQVFTLKSAKVMGQDEKFGNSYWCYVEEIDLPVMFSSHSIVKGFETISADESVSKTSVKGNAYLLLKKVKVAESSSPSKDDIPDTFKGSSGKTPQAIAGVDFSEVLKKLDEILEYVRPLDKVVEPTKDELDGIFDAD